jgi:SAM-dependent methyltransferase
MQCRICGNEKENQEYQVREMMFGYRDLFKYFQCSRCRCLQISEVPKDLGKYYPASYYSYSSRAPLSSRAGVRGMIWKLRTQYAVFNKGILGRLLYAKFPEVILRSLSLVSLTKESRVLDVGCGAGNLVYALRELGFEHLLGIDPFNDRDYDYPNGVHIRKLHLDEVQGTWDLVMFHHSFEHVPDPLDTLATVHRMLNPGGQCLIRIPTVSSYAWEHYRTDWVQLDAPRHLFLHSRESMSILAGKTGYEISRIAYDSDALQFMGSEQNMRDVPLRDSRSYVENPGKSMFTGKQIAEFARRAADLNKSGQGDQAAFCLRRV